MRVNPVCRGELNPPIHSGFTGGLRELNTLPLALLRFLCSFVVKFRKCAFGVMLKRNLQRQTGTHGMGSTDK